MPAKKPRAEPCEALGPLSDTTTSNYASHGLKGYPYGLAALALDAAATRLCDTPFLNTPSLLLFLFWHWRCPLTHFCSTVSFAPPPLLATPAPHSTAHPSYGPVQARASPVTPAFPAPGRRWLTTPAARAQPATALHPHPPLLSCFSVVAHRAGAWVREAALLHRLSARPACLACHSRVFSFSLKHSPQHTAQRSTAQPPWTSCARWCRFHVRRHGALAPPRQVRAVPDGRECRHARRLPSHSQLLASA
jgi:hypothetical protein